MMATKPETMMWNIHPQTWIKGIDGCFYYRSFPIYLWCDWAQQKQAELVNALSRKTSAQLDAIDHNANELRNIHHFLTWCRANGHDRKPSRSADSPTRREHFTTPKKGGTR